MKAKAFAAVFTAILSSLSLCGCNTSVDYRVTYSYRSEITSTVSEVSPTDAEIVLFTDTQKAGKNATLAIKAKPQTEYRIEVEYSSGVSTSKQLQPKKSDSKGYVAWLWRIGHNTKPDTYPVRVYYGDTLVLSLALQVEAS